MDNKGSQLIASDMYTPTTVVPVILCGGSGTRLWPLSRAGFPKQFLVLQGNRSLFQQAFTRLQALAGPHHAIAQNLIITNEEHRFLALDQLHELGRFESDSSETHFILEPQSKNTAPALTLAALEVAALERDPILVVTPADQVIEDQGAFTRAVHKAIALAQSDAIVILGVRPTKPETGYGYIKASVADARGNHTVEQFMEKPDLALAQQYCAQGDFYWNSGMFVLKASVWLKALQLFRPDIAAATQSAYQNQSTDQLSQVVFVRPNKEAFAAIPADSIDYAVIEKCPGSAIGLQMVPLDAGWNDLGAWDAVWQSLPHNADGNIEIGDVITDNSKNSLVIANHRLVSTVGVNNLIVVETADAVLVASQDQSQQVKAIVHHLSNSNRTEKDLHRKVHRPWGWYDSIDEGERFKVKRIQVKPGASLSLQMHAHRAEHWIVVKGIAQITNGEDVITLHENQSTYIPQGQKHRLANPGTTPLEIIEVQSGSYLGEDDIVRFEDVYGR